MRKGLYILFFTVFFLTFLVMLQRQYNIISLFEPSTLASKGKDQEYIETLREAMVKRETDIVVSFTGTAEEIKEYSVSAVDEVFRIDRKDTSNDFDYLRYNYAGANITMSGFGRSFQVSYKIDYLETREEMDKVDKRVKKILKELKVDGKSEYKRVKRIHDYIVKNASYDESGKNNSAYANLFKKKSACQGYATLVYKMMTEAGIPCRIIAGKSSGEAHAWNIVKIDGKWYNLDCTWDDPLGEPDPAAVHYEFFLKSDTEFKDHIRDKEYDSIEFRTEHPVSVISYGN